MAWRDVIKQTIYGVVTQPEVDPLTCVREAVVAKVSFALQSEVLALVVQELNRLHERVLARYGLRPSEFVAWKARQRG